MHASVMPAPVTPDTFATVPTRSPFETKYTSQQVSPPVSLPRRKLRQHHNPRR